MPQAVFCRLLVSHSFARPMVFWICWDSSAKERNELDISVLRTKIRRLLHRLTVSLKAWKQLLVVETLQAPCQQYTCPSRHILAWPPVLLCVREWVALSILVLSIVLGR
ncbi:hypothetical protein V8E54_002143 [Elaphomyces granulatus]